MQALQPLTGAVSGRGKCKVQSVEEASARAGCSQCKACAVSGRQVQGKWRKCSQWRISRCPLTDARLLSSSLPCSDSLNHTFSASLFKNPSDMLIHTFGKKLLHLVKTHDAASQAGVL